MGLQTCMAIPRFYYMGAVDLNFSSHAYPTEPSPQPQELPRQPQIKVSLSSAVLKIECMLVVSYPTTTTAQYTCSSN